jgi:methionine synthase II (cobalamin-independent)
LWRARRLRASASPATASTARRWGRRSTILQIDDPSIAENWDQINPEPTVADYQRVTMTRVEALNHALRGLPTDRVRFHLCWGSWHGPHTTDIQMRDIIDVMLAINAGGYSFEAANARHEHEWTVWRDVKLPDGKVILPGIVSHATNVVEHPELVAQRIARFAEVVGRENVIASTDCGLGGVGATTRNRRPPRNSGGRSPNRNPGQARFSGLTTGSEPSSTG